MTFKTLNIHLCDIELSVKDLLRVNHLNGTAEYVPMYYLSLITEKMKYYLSNIDGNNIPNNSIDFSITELNDLY
ncbi:MAG: hypothetical protein AB1782_12590 [Cyanobacteriota bacterium]